MKDRYFKLYSRDSFMFYVQDCDWLNTGRLEYSFDAIFWEELGTKKVNVATPVNGVYELYLRGTGNTSIPGNKFKCIRKSKGRASIRVSGEIETLLDYTKVFDDSEPDMIEGCYEGMFENCDYLVDVSGLVISHAKAAKACSRMFKYCRALEKPPELPETELGEGCYKMMFEGCVSLKRSPEIPASVIGKDSCNRMFKGCISLNEADDIYADTALDHSCTSMFEGCESLELPPFMEIVFLGDSCFERMFAGCKSLKKAPVLAADVLKENCYKEMFSGCEALEKKPPIHPDAQGKLDRFNMFSGCNLKPEMEYIPKKAKDDILPKIRIPDMGIY